MKNELVFPGSSIKELIVKDCQSSNKKIVLGPGIKREIDDIKAVKCGFLRSSIDTNCSYWLDSYQKRYVAVRGERVIGIVVAKASFSVNLDIGTSDHASLSLLAFEGATKRNKPNIQIGDLVYARILSANKDIKPECVCISVQGKKEGLGVLPSGGYLITLPLNVIRRLLSPGCKLLEKIGSKFKYEITVGMNGRVWVKSPTISGTIFICNALSQLEHKKDSELEKYCENVFLPSKSK